MNYLISEIQIGQYVMGQGFVCGIQVAPQNRRQISFADPDGTIISIKVFDLDDVVTVDLLEV